MTISADPVPLHVDPSGTIRVAGTRLTLESLLAVHQQGKTPEETVECFSGITLGDVYAVLAYSEYHRAEVDAYLVQQEADSEAVWQEVEEQRARGSAQVDPFRERVLARRGRMQQKQEESLYPRTIS